MNNCTVYFMKINYIVYFLVIQYTVMYITCWTEYQVYISYVGQNIIHCKHRTEYFIHYRKLGCINHTVVRIYVYLHWPEHLVYTITGQNSRCILHTVDEISSCNHVYVYTSSTPERRAALPNIQHKPCLIELLC